MKLSYIDESGTGLKDKGSPFFVLLALGIDAVDFSFVDREVIALKRRLIPWAKPEDFEIKGRDLHHGEKLFVGLKWEQRVKAIRAVAQLIVKLPCRAFAVVVDKRHLPEYVATDSDLYRLAFWRLLDGLDVQLRVTDDYGLLMVDARSDLHSSVQDRRLVDAYREWVAFHSSDTPFLELPWFGFSAFYAGLQLADFVAYLTALVAREREHGVRQYELHDAFLLVEPKLTMVTIP